MNLPELATDLTLTLSQMSTFAAYAAILGVLLLCGLGLPVPEDITLLAAGFLASTGQISFGGALAAGFFGVLAGDTFLFFMGRKFGARIFKLPGFRRVFTPSRVEQAEARVRRNGHFICFIARFLPGMRAPIFALAGAMGVRPSVFFVQDGFAAAISVPAWVYLGYWFGSNWQAAFQYAEKLQVWILIAAVTLVAGYILYRKYKKRRAALTQFPQA